MLSVREMQARLNLLLDVRQQGQDAAAMCRIRVREMPLVTAGEDASEYIPFAIHPDVAGQLTQAIRRLREHMQQYIIDGVTVSAHKLPQHDARSRAMMQALRANQPQISQHLLHHWCADEQGAGGLRRFLHDNWLKAWKSELGAPSGGSVAERRLQWLGAVHILLLGLIREEIQSLPDEHAEMTDLIMVHVLGASCQWMVQEFSDQHLADVSDAERSAVVQRLAIPATPLAFFRRQPKGKIFSDAGQMVTAYGLEAELLPRMRQVVEAMPNALPADILAELASEGMSDHLLMRSWARISLRDMAEGSGQSVWLKWSLDAKRLDALLSTPGKVAAELETALAAVDKCPFAAWLIAQGNKGLLSRSRDRSERPWQQDERLLQFFWLFEEDARLESERRNARERWLNREAALVGPGRGSEAGRLLVEAHARGKVVLLQKDAAAPLFIGGGTGALQGVLYVDWSEYLRVVQRHTQSGMQRFLEHGFQPGIAELVKSLDGVFTDSFSASGLLLRGSPSKLLFAGVALRSLLGQWFEELEGSSEVTDKDEPVVSMCLAVMGDWSIVRQGEAGMGGRLAFSHGVAQAKAAVSRNEGLRRLLLSFDARDGKRPLGGIRIEGIKMADGKNIPILCNRGYALTGSALKALMRSSAELHLQAFQAPREEAGDVLGSFRLPAGQLEGFLIHAVGSAGEEAEAHLLLRIGKVLLGATVEDIYEMMAPEVPGYKPLMAAIVRWRGSHAS